MSATPISLSALKPPMPGPWARAGIHDHERPPDWIDLYPFRRNDARQGIVHGPGKRPAVEDQLRRVVQNMRRRFCAMLQVLVAALAHRVHEEHLALRGVDEVSKSRRQHVIVMPSANESGVR